MDPKLSGLDPKLREAYERVMNGPTGPGGSTPPTPSQQPGQEQPPAQVSNPVAPTPPPPPAATPPPPSPALNPTPPPSVAPSSPSASFSSGSFQTAQGTTAVKKAGGKMSTILILLGLAVLLVAYTFVWVFLFDLKIPFLPF